jgi:hypothetical protein
MAPNPDREEHVVKNWILTTAATVALAAALAAPALAHHSFAMYDQQTTKTLTGKLTRFIPGGNHAQLIFEVLGNDGKPQIDKNGKPLQWGVETGSAAALARQGITVESFPPGTIFTVTLAPLRDGRTFGAQSGPLIKCGAAMPQGGCTEKTGQVLGNQNN